MRCDRVLLRIHNRTGLTIHTSAHASSPARAVSEGPVEMPAAAWEHTLSCAPGLRSLVGEGDGMIEVTEVGAAKVEPVEAAPVVASPVDATASVDAEVVPEAGVATPALASVASPEPKPMLIHKGKRR